jgi:amidohydrolase
MDLKALQEQLKANRHLGNGGPRSINGDAAIVTLDFVDPDASGNAPAMCFCVDCFSDDAEKKGGRVDRILSHVSPSSAVPRNLLGDLNLSRIQDGYAPGEIPWCSEVKPEPEVVVAAAPVAASSASGAKTIALQVIDDEAVELDKIAEDLWANPEVGYEEVYAHDRVASFLEAHGVTVQRSYLGITTALRADFRKGDGPTVGIQCEYDALPGIGHACGHNLICEASVGAFLGVKAALEAGECTGGVVLYGTPAEEQQGGKIEILNRHGYADIDVALMAHPSPGMMLYPGMLAREMLKVTYHGVNAHAASNPWQGVNALDATVQGYTNVAMMRQQFKPSWRVHGVITDGGTEPNIIPAVSSSRWYIRAPNMEDLAELHAKVEGCMKAAAESTGCEAQLEWQGDHKIFDHDEYESASRTYADILTNPTLAETFRANWDMQDTELTYRSVDEDKAIATAGGGSSDMGNISHIMPGIHPSFMIETKFGNHHPGFTEFTVKPQNMAVTRVAAKAIAGTTIDMLSVEGLVDEAKAAFEAQKASSVMWEPNYV